MLAETLGAITSQKNTSLQNLVWGYADNEEQKMRWLDMCIAQANTKARRIASGLGVQLLGIVSFSETYSDPEAGVSPQSESGPYGRSRARNASTFTEDLGMEVSHTKTIKLTVSVTYRSQ